MIVLCSKISRLSSWSSGELGLAYVTVRVIYAYAMTIRRHTVILDFGCILRVKVIVIQMYVSNLKILLLPLDRLAAGPRRSLVRYQA